jgi:hypothetical protein
MRKDICWTPKMCGWILVGLIDCPQNGAKDTDKAWHSAVETLLSPLRNLDIAVPGLKWDYADGLQ